MKQVILSSQESNQTENLQSSCDLFQRETNTAVMNGIPSTSHKTIKSAVI